MQYKASYSMQPIKELPIMERPRERMSHVGIENLSDFELMAAIIGSGGPGLGVEKIAAEAINVFDECKNDEEELFRRLEKVHGLKKGKSAAIVAAYELSRRLIPAFRRSLREPKDLYSAIRHYAERDREVFLAITLNGAFEILSVDVVSVGTVNHTLVHPRDVFKVAIEKNAVGVAVAHNHPTGCLEPSEHDLKTTDMLKKSADILKIPLVDHMIFSLDGYFSMKEKGLV